MTLAAGETAPISFAVVRGIAGTYEVRLDKLMGSFAVLKGAAFKSTNLVISPPEVKVGEPVTISADVANIGEVEGSYTLTLKINEVVEATEDVILASGQSTTVSFVVTKDVADIYNVEVDGLFGSFAVAKPVDITPPVISAVSLSNITTTSATISWTTDEAATSQVEYGTTVTYGLTTPLDPALVTSHKVVLSGLDPDTTYHFRVKSQDAAGNLAVSDRYRFNTAKPVDITPPVISAVSVSDVTTASATISWTTDEAATSQVEYGTTVTYGLTTPLDPALVTSHSVVLSGLEPDTTYHFRVKSQDAAGNLAVSDDYTFTTLAPPFPWWLVGIIILIVLVLAIAIAVGVSVPRRPGSP